MSQDKELEIQLQFLDEAHEYITTIESAILGIANRGVDLHQINGALRGAHSVKGGAAMMGFQALSEFAHRLEDSFKVLKVQKDQLDLDGDLEHLLLQGVDCLHHLIQVYRQQQEIDSAWINTEAMPIFDQLHDRLGEPQSEDANSVLSPEDGQDILPLLFQTEVEGCLQRIETVIAERKPCLQEEIEILAQELEGLGEMLQLSAFSQLCRSVTHALQTHPEQVDTIAHSALEAWRRSQALVLTGHLDAIPTLLEGFESPDQREPESVVMIDPALQNETDGSLSDSLVADSNEAIADSETDWDRAAASLENVDISTFALTDKEAIDHDRQESEFTFTEPLNVSVGDRSESYIEMIVDSELEDDDFQENVIRTPTTDTLDAEFISSSTSDRWTSTSSSSQYTPPIPGIVQNSPSTQGFHSTSNSGRRVAEVYTADDESTTDNTVRVPVKQLDQLNDLFGELTIERNRLDMEVKRLRGLLHQLGDRVQSLDQASIAIRNTYDRVTLNTNSKLSSLLPPARNGDGDANLLAQSTIPNTSDGAIAHLNTFDSLEMDQYGNLHLVFQDIMETIVQVQEVTSDLDIGLEDTEQTARDLNKTSKQLRNNLTQLRMRPLSDITDRFPRALRELSLKHDKSVRLELQGSHTLVDRNVLEALNDPMMHIIRNAFDHGIETPEQRRAAGKLEEGQIEIKAQHQSNHTIITIRDDGRGIPIDKIRKRAKEMGLDEGLLAAASDEELLSLIFEPGFSTADQVTDLSGRGVGMDVVRNNLRQVRGEITVRTQAGVGTTFTITVPLVLAVTRVLIVESNRMLLAFPSDVVEEMILLTPDKIVRAAGNEAFDWEGMMVQLIRLSTWLNFNCPRPLEGIDENPTIADPSVLLLRQNNQLIGIQVDRCWGEQEVAMRRVAGGLPLPPGFGNCTILGDGSVVPLISISDLLYWIAGCEQARKGAIAPDQPDLPHIRSFVGNTSEEPNHALEQKSTVLVVDDSVNVRRLLALTLEKAGYQVAQAKDGQDAVEKLTAGLSVDAVICDIEMPRLDGYGFLAKIRSTPDLKLLPIAMLTSRSGEKHRNLAMNLGASAYFAKPYNEQKLLQTLNDLITLTPAS